MRKLLVCVLAVVSVLMFSAPASAAEKTPEERIRALEDVIMGLSFYGSLRYDTFYMKSDSDFTSDSDPSPVTKLNATPQLTLPSQRMTEWGLASNSRLGISFDRAEGIGGRVELGFRSDSTVSLREGYGTYKTGDLTFLFGQSYAPLSDWDYSNQVFNADNNLAGWGMLDVDGKRIPQVKMTWKGLQVALVQNKDASVLNLSTAAAPALPQLAAVNPKTEVLYPVLEARYRLKTDVLFGDIFGGYTSYRVKADNPDIDRKIKSYAYGVGGGVTVKPVYGKAMIWRALNGRQMSLHQAYCNAEDVSKSLMGAVFNTDFSLVHERDMGYALVAGLKAGNVNIESGYGYVTADKAGNSLGLDSAERARNYYLNSTIPIAQTSRKAVTFTISPEIGIYDYIKDFRGNKQGKISYAGAKWQVNF